MARRAAHWPWDAVVCRLPRLAARGPALRWRPALSADGATAIMRFRDLTLGYDGRAAVHHLGGTLRAGSFTAVVGPNGSGKSTLLRGIAGLLKPLGGGIVDSAVRRGEIAYLPQHVEIDRGFPVTVADLVALGLWNRRGLFGRRRAEDRAAIDAALTAVGLDGFQERAIDTLSGGQLQRILFARVLLQDARLILLDEPFNAIDPRTVADLIAIMHRWHGERRTVVAVLHDMNLVREHFPETLLLARWPVAWARTEEALKPENLLRARHLNEAWQADAPWCERQDAA